MTVPIHYLLITLGGCAVLAILLYRKSQKYNELNIDYLTQKFDIFKQRARELRSIADAILLLQQYKSIFPVKFFLNNNLEKPVIAALVSKVRATNNCDELFSLIGDLAHRLESDPGFMLWKKIKFEVLSHLKSVSEANNHNFWLKGIINSKT